MFLKSRRKEIARMSEGWGVEHVTLDPEGPTGPVRLHLHPAANGGPSLLFINGSTILPLEPGPAMLLRIFMQELKKVCHPGEEVSEESLARVVEITIGKMHSLYPRIKNFENKFADDLAEIQQVVFSIAGGEWPEELRNLKAMTMAQYAKYMTGPFRMDLAVMPTRLNGKWSCPNCCGACYAKTGTAMDVGPNEILTTQQWEDILDILWKAGVSQVSFTGGEPTEREDLPKLIQYAQEFTTRLNTCGRKLKDINYCWQLKEVSLDVVQVTVYSHDSEIHNKLVGSKNAWSETMQGIRNSLAVGLEVSVNIPLVEENVYSLTETMEYLHAEMGVRYFTCSGLLPAGGAKKLMNQHEDANEETLYYELRRAKALADHLNLELEFTSPGSIDSSKLAELGFQNIPVCGACLGNMAISPKGIVLPCQSWVHERDGLGNILETSWKEIWNSKACKGIRSKAANNNDCPLRMEEN